MKKAKEYCLALVLLYGSISILLSLFALQNTNTKNDCNHLLASSSLTLMLSSTSNSYLDQSSSQYSPTIWSNQTELLQTKFGISTAISDTAYLRHCNLSKINVTIFQTFRELIWKKSSLSLETLEAQNSNNNNNNKNEMIPLQHVKDELTLQALELYAMASTNVCDFTQYKPMVATTNSQHHQQQDATAVTRIRQLQQQQQQQQQKTNEARCVFVISAYQDFPQLQSLVESILLPQHLIIIHLERRQSNPEFYNQVQQLATKQSNILLIQYGSVTYTTDSLTNINFEIMRWVVEELGYTQFDYYLQLSSSVYPLWEAHELARYLQDHEKRPRIGTMVDFRNIARQCFRMNSGLSILYTRGNGKVQKQRIINLDDGATSNLLKDAQVLYNENFPTHDDFLGAEYVNKHCKLKTNSGNTAAYDRKTVLDLLQSADAAWVLARSKYTANCCAEEYNWGLALTVIGRTQQDIEAPGAVWQAWPCVNHQFGNSVLTNTSGDAAPCWRIQDTAGGKTGKHGRQISNLQQELREAKARGQLFARKFHSSDPYWIRWIEENLWNNNYAD